MCCNDGIAGHDHGVQQALQRPVGPRVLGFLLRSAAVKAARLKVGLAKKALMFERLRHLAIVSDRSRALVGVLQIAVRNTHKSY